MAAAILIPMLAPLGVQLLTSIMPGVTKELQSLIVMGLDKLFGNKTGTIKKTVGTAIFMGLGQAQVEQGKASPAQIPTGDQIGKSIDAAVAELQPVLKGHDTVIPLLNPINPAVASSDSKDEAMTRLELFLELAGWLKKGTP